MTQLVWPDLSPPYDRALSEAVFYILENFDALGILACGTIIQGHPDPHSDLDIQVIHNKPVRQRIQKFFNGVPAEIFINPPRMIRQYIKNERNRPRTAHMIAQGFVILNSDTVVLELQDIARQALKKPPAPGEDELILLRYMAATRYEDARDVARKKPEIATMILNQAIHDMLHYVFRQAHQFIPRDKDLLDKLECLDTGLTEIVRQFYLARSSRQRFELAKRIAECTIQTDGFFEWSSPPEKLES